MKTISVGLLLRILYERELEGIYGMLMFADFFYNHGCKRVEFEALTLTSTVVVHVCDQGCSPRGICLGSRRPRGSFLAGSASPRPHTVLPRSCLSLDLTASASAVPHSFCLGLGSVWKVAPCLGSVVISQLKRASAHGAQVQVQRYTQRLCLLLEMNNEEFLNVCF